MRNQVFTTKRKQPEYYRGMLIHADTGLHEQMLALFEQYVAPGKRILDIGAGAGAFSRRLSDTGYIVTAADLKPVEQWNFAEIPFMSVDLNQESLNNIFDKTFDAACCMEVIEHVENPWKLLRDIHALLPSGGRLILSTPNITSFFSRMIFLRYGIFHQFGEADLSYGHISPITLWELSVIAQQTGWQILEVRPGGYLPLFDFTSFRPKSWLMNWLRYLAYLVATGQKHGWCLLVVLEKS